MPTWNNCTPMATPERDPRGRVVTVAYFALIPADAPIRPEGGTDAAGAAWQPANELPALAFDHAQIVAYALRRLRYKLEYSAVGFELLPEEFTLTEIQKTYEMILGEELDKRNFRRRIQSANIIEATPHMRTGEGRPAAALPLSRGCCGGSQSPALISMSQPTESPPERLPRNVWVLAVTSILTDVSSEMLFYLLPLFLPTCSGCARR